MLTKVVIRSETACMNFVITITCNGQDHSHLVHTCSCTHRQCWTWCFPDSPNRANRDTVMAKWRCSKILLPARPFRRRAEAADCCIANELSWLWCEAVTAGRREENTGGNDESEANIWPKSARVADCYGLHLVLQTAFWESYLKRKNNLTAVAAYKIAITKSPRPCSRSVVMIELARCPLPAG